MRTRREFIVLLGGAAAVRRSSAQDRPARILYFTHSAGYRHEQICLKRVSHPTFGSRAQLSDKCRRPGDVGRIYESAARRGRPVRWVARIR